MENNSKKTGATPLPEAADLGGGEILGLWEAKPFMIRLLDGHGKEVVEIAFRLPNGDLYFLKGDVKFAPAQKWVSAAVTRKLSTDPDKQNFNTVEQG